MSSILVLGGSGIISKEIISLAIDHNYTVTMVNRGQRKSFIHPKATCVIADLRQESLTTLLGKISETFDTVMDFIAYTPQELQRNMELARGRCTQYIFISSATVYNAKEGRYTETDPIGETGWNYAADKAACERYLAENAKACGFAYTIIRPYVTYGETRIPLQFAPVEYYTIIHRMRCGKGIPLFADEAACTLTTAKDFAVAAVGLIQRNEAMEQIFHITGAYETTWNRALEAVAGAFGQSYDAIPLPARLLRNTRLMDGLNAQEVLSDKGRNMLFDNTKIRSVVPGFTGSTTLEEELVRIAAYFNENPAARRVNYIWDGLADRMLSKSKRLTSRQKRALHFCPAAQATVKDRIAYTVGRYRVPYTLLVHMRRRMMPALRRLKRAIAPRMENSENRT